MYYSEQYDETSSLPIKLLETCKDDNHGRNDGIVNDAIFVIDKNTSQIARFSLKDQNDF